MRARRTAGPQQKGLREFREETTFESFRWVWTLTFSQKRSGRATERNHKGRQEKIILYAGRLIDVKGVEYLIKALPAVLEKQANAKLLVVGSGPCKKDLVSLTERLNLQDKVTFLDAVSQEELLRYYSIGGCVCPPIHCQRRRGDRRIRRGAS